MWYAGSTSCCSPFRWTKQRRRDCTSSMSDRGGNGTKFFTTTALLKKGQASPQPARRTAQLLSARSGELAACQQPLPSEQPSDDRWCRETVCSTDHGEC